MNDIYSCVTNNGYWSDWFKITRGFSQGCCLSPLNYLVIAEVLGDKIRNNNKINGITIHGQEFKGAQYADDFWLPLLYEKDNLNEVLKVLEDFYKFTGLKVYYHKSAIVPIGVTTVSAVRLDTTQLLK